MFIFYLIDNLDLQKSANSAQLLILGERERERSGLSNWFQLNLGRNRIRSIAVYRPQSLTCRDLKSKGWRESQWDASDDDDDDDRICESIEHSRSLKPAGAVETTRPRLVCLRRASVPGVGEGLPPYLIKLLLRIDCQTWALGRSLQRRLSKFAALTLS